jgi:hypothetical protein
MTTDFGMLLELSLEAAGYEDAESPCDALCPLPTYLYHSSAYKQDELKPGFKHSGELVRWDGVEDNTWLYSCDKKQDAMMLGISSAIEKKWNLQRYKYDAKAHRLDIEVVGEDVSKSDIEKLNVYIYTIRPDAEDGWVENFNPVNGMNGEYKTQGTVTDNVLRCEPVDIVGTLRGYTINIKRVPGESFESFSDLISGVKNLFSKPKDRKKEHAEAIPKQYFPVNAAKVQAYLTEFFGNKSWLAKQSFADSVSSNGIAQPLSVNGKFVDSMAGLKTAVAHYIQVEQTTYDTMSKMDSEVQAVHEKYSALIMTAIKAGDHDKVTKLTEEACAAFKAIKIPFAKMAPLVLLGGDVSTAQDTPKNHRGLPVAVSSKEVPVKVGPAIKALTPKEIEEAVGIVRELLGVGKKVDSRKYLRWLDFEDGSDFSDAIYDFSNNDYMKYYEMWYFQHVDGDIGWSLPGLSSLVTDTTVALLHWMDRSVK